MRILFFHLLLISANIFAQAVLINHDCAKLEPIPVSAVNLAKSKLHIAYGHTSHGSQLTDGMQALIGKVNLIGYKGDIYRWNNGGSGDALDLNDYAMSGDLGHNGDTAWAAETRAYLNNPANSRTNVIMWSWCGGCSDNTTVGINAYLQKMEQLESAYPNVKFIYMTGHRDIWSDEILKRNNQQIRDYAMAHNKILYDFADIESFGPDGTYYEYANDNCDYYNRNTQLQGNWAVEYQNSHQEGRYWYSMSAAHSEPVNGNRKAYAAWWMFCRIAGWNGLTDIDDETNTPKNTELLQNFPNPFNPTTRITYSLNKKAFVSLKVHDILGNETAMLVNEENPAGKYEVNFNAVNLPSGVYFYTLSTGTFSQTKKLLIIK